MKDAAGQLSRKSIQKVMIISAIEGLVALFFTFLHPSENESAVFAGYSAQRFILGGITLVGVALFLLIGTLFSENHPRSEQRVQSLNDFLRQNDRIFFSLVILSGLTLFAIWCFVFSWLFIPANLRPQIIWVGLIALQSLLCIRRSYGETIRQNHYAEKYRLFPRWKDLSANQKKVFRFLVILSVAYILILIPSNLNGSQNMEAFARYGGDEFVIYPILMDIMKPGETFSATLYHLFIYEDYHYGYPFYAWSTLVLLPIKWISGENFAEQIQINLPLLRIFVSVIPVILACLVLTFLFTRWKSFWISAPVFLFLLSAPGTLQNNQGFWHPDGLNLLFVCLTLYFLQRDRFRYGRNFYLAAVFTGLSVATRLYGFFFFLAILVYLILGLLRRINSLGGTIRKGVFFIFVMASVILFADPFLFRADAREKMVTILRQKSTEMAEGYVGDYDPRNDYRTGWDAWYPAFEDHYTEMYCFFFLVFSLVFASFFGDQKLTHLMTLCWCVVIISYLVFFVAVKSTQYVLPALLPLMASVFSIPQAVETGQVPAILRHKSIRIGSWIVAGGILVSQFIINLIKIAPRF